MAAVSASTGKVLIWLLLNSSVVRVSSAGSQEHCTITILAQTRQECLEKVGEAPSLRYPLWHPHIGRIAGLGQVSNPMYASIRFGWILLYCRGNGSVRLLNPFQVPSWILDPTFLLHACSCPTRWQHHIPAQLGSN